jgi:uncharacterized Zn-binding protein involved in type VI secretion
MAAAARLGDPISCGDTIAGGSGNVFFNGMPVARVGDPTAGHPCGPPTSLAAGNGSNVFANGISIAIIGSAIAVHGTCSGPPHPGAVSTGSPDVLIG